MPRVETVLPLRQKLTCTVLNWSQGNLLDWLPCKWQLMLCQIVLRLGISVSQAAFSNRWICEYQTVNSAHCNALSSTEALALCLGSLSCRKNEPPTPSFESSFIHFPSILINPPVPAVENYPPLHDAATTKWHNQDPLFSIICNIILPDIGICLLSKEF